MKKDILKYIVILMLFIQNFSFAQVTLEGVITDNKDHQPLVGAIVYIPDLRSGVSTDLNGKYLLGNLPARKFIVHVRLVGYKTYTKSIDLSKESSFSVELEPATIEAGEVVVTGSAFTTNHEEATLPIVPMERKQLINAGATNITDALTQVAGVSGISTGTAISKPVIRGLGYNRIVTVNEGLRQEGQQWGDEHGLEIDMFNADRIEILKGPSSLLYGSDALGGVINILEPLPAPLGLIRGSFDGQWSTNNNGYTSSLMLEGNQQGYIWKGRATYRNNAAYATPAERVYNAANNELNSNVLFGWNRKWGFSHIHFSSYQAKLGLIEGERDTVSGNFINPDGVVISDASAFSREVGLPFQQIHHIKVSSVNSFFIGKSNLRFVAGWQQNNRQEFETSATTPGLYFQLNTFTGDAKYYFPESNGWQTVAGVNYLFQMNSNKGKEYLIPDYTMNDIGGFISVQKKLGAININAGVREEYRVISGNKLVEDETVLFESFDNSFSALSGSLGMAWQLNESFNLKLNAGRGFRAPNISELSANGVHEGTFRYEIGNHDLLPETSLQFDAGIGFEQHVISTEVSVFYNYIDKFIYYRNIAGEDIEVNGDLFPVFRYIQGNSVLKGFETSIDLHPVERLHFSNTFAYVEGLNTATNKPLPFIPPFHYKGDLRYTIDNLKGKVMRNSFLRLTFDYYDRQNKIDQFETVTKSAAVLGAGIGTEIRIAGAWVDVNITGTNISDVRYFNHLSRLKEAGIMEMGRNFTFAVSVPFNLKK